MPDELQSVTHAFKSFCERNGFTVLVDGVEKHGGWEWSCWKHLEFNRYITLHMTEITTELRQERAYIAEFWAAADDDQRYTRKLVSSVQVNESDLNYRQMDRAKWLTDRLTVALARMSVLGEQDLTESYLRPRKPPGRERHQAAG
jgi:hypothetical protein